jgi:NAD(P)-dependent dehydrogenase (short-subunit alcohol dehydrogenase family)
MAGRQPEVKPQSMPLAQHPLDCPFGGQSTAEEVVHGIDLGDKTAIVTGASAGIGAETARALALAGARLILAVRSLEKGQAIAHGIRQSTGNERIEIAYLDLGVWSSVRAFASEILRRDIPIHILIDNAGLMPATLQLVEGRIEAQFGSNHLGHMLLSCQLAPALRKGAPARVVVVSSAAHRRLPARFDDVNFETRPYDKLEAYSIAKSANALFACEFNRRLEAQGVTAYAVNPGPVFTAIQNAFSPDEMKAMEFHDSEGNRAGWFRSASQGAATSVWCATSPLLSAGGGVYCEDCNVAELRREAATTSGPAALKGVRPWAVDPKLARELWTLSEAMLGDRFSL